MHGVCGRPGCDEPASATFGFDGARAVVWLHPLDEPEGAGWLCTRHADALVVPRGWTLHDRRKSPRRRASVPRTATPRTIAPLATTPRAATPTRPRPERRRQPAPAVAAPAVAPPAAAPPAPAAAPTLPFPERPARTVRPPAWAKRVDPDDAIDALLDAGTPLLSRAFRNAR